MLNILGIAGFDPSGAAGIMADLKTVSSLGGYFTGVVTALTAQNTSRVSAVKEAGDAFLQRQLEAVAEDFRIDGIKIGMLYSRENIETVSRFLKGLKSEIPVVLDPVIISTSGYPLLEKEAAEALKEKLFPLCTAITPNIPEAEFLSSHTVKEVKDMEKAAKELLKYGPGWVIVKGGHLEGEPVDIAASQEKIHRFKSQRIEKGEIRGTGCAFSSALAFYLAAGLKVPEAVSKTKTYLEEAIRQSFRPGQGCPVLKHFI